MTCEILMKIYQVRNGPQILQKFKSFLWIPFARRMSLKQVSCLGSWMFNEPVNLAVSRLQLGAYALTNIFVWKGSKFNNYAENFRRHLATFSRLEFVHTRACV